MSEPSQSAHVRIVLADYAVSDQQTKMTVVGGGVNIFGVNTATGSTAPFAVWASASFDPAFIGDNPAVELSLENAEGHLVYMPGLADAPPQALRVASAEKLLPTVLKGADIPQSAVRPKTQILLQFQNGLPLAAGHRYLWRVKVDGETRPDWTEVMFVPLATAGPVVG